METIKPKLFRKTIVITGASSGVGKAMAITLARHGARLALVARRSEALEATAQECRRVGGDAVAVALDIRSIDNIQAVIEQALLYNGTIDVWINNAGVLAAGLFEDVPNEVNEEVIRTNLLGYMQCAHEVIPVFKRQGHGILINNISVGGWFPTPYAAAYTASKFALRGFSDALKAELLPFTDIHVCDLYPGFLDTPGMQHAANYTGKKLMPAPPVYDPQKVANAVVRVVQKPKQKTTIGAASTLLRMAYRVVPGLSLRMTAGMMRMYFRQADHAETTSGNVVRADPAHTTIGGGWRKTLARTFRKKSAVAAVGLLGMIISAVAVRNRR